MNPKMILRAIDRHRYMLDAKGYELFLQDLTHEPGIWKVPQNEFARWWRRRNEASLRFTPRADGLLVECTLEGACVAWDGDRVMALPTVLPGVEAPRATPSVCVDEVTAVYASELARHLGYAHVEIRVGGATDALGEELARTLEGFRDRTIDAKVYTPKDLEAVRSILVRALHGAGLPDLRLWSMPAQGGIPYRAAMSPRFDVDKAIVNLPRIVALQDRFDVVGTFYLRPVGIFYGRREIRSWGPRVGANELALHGEFVTTAESRSCDEVQAATHERSYLSEMIERDVEGVCIHGGELRTNLSPRTAIAIDGSGFSYETTSYNRDHTWPLFMPRRHKHEFRTTLTMIRHQDDVTVPLSPQFPETMAQRFRRDFDVALAQGGVFIPTMHPLYFSVGNYLRYPSNLARIVGFLPIFLKRAIDMKSGHVYVNQGIREEGPEGC